MNESAFERYDPARDRWQALPRPPLATSGIALEAVAGPPRLRRR